MDEKRTTRKNQKKSFKKRILYILLTGLLLALGVSGYLFSQVYNAANNSYEGLERTGDKSALRKETVTIGDDPISILLLGVEDYSSGGKNGRADTQIVVTLNPDTEKMTMTTINRDTRVELNKVGQYNGIHKINAAYTFGEITEYGGNKLAVETVEALLGIPIDKYIAVNFEGFKDIVDVLGGVSLDIKEGFWEKNIYNNNERIYFESGPTVLNGEEALAFVRMRKRDVNAIYPREERQRQFIRATIDEAVSADTIFKVDDISSVLGENIETNLKPKEIYTLQKAYSSIRSDSIETLEIKGVATAENNWLFIPNENSLQQVTSRLQKELQIDATEKSSE